MRVSQMGGHGRARGSRVARLERCDDRPMLALVVEATGLGDDAIAQLAELGLLARRIRSKSTAAGSIRSRASINSAGLAPAAVAWAVCSGSVATKVPRPTSRRMQPSASRSAKVRRTALRGTPNRSANSRSVGNRRPAALSSRA